MSKRHLQEKIIAVTQDRDQWFDLYNQAMTRLHQERRLNDRLAAATDDLYSLLPADRVAMVRPQTRATLADYRSLVDPPSTF